MSRFSLTIVGQAPSRSAGAEVPLDGRSGRRLAEVAGTSMEEIRRRATVVNLVDRWHGPSRHGKGDAFPTAEGRTSAEAIEASVPPGGRVLLLGRHVARAFGFAGRSFLRWHPSRRRSFAVVPHPSGVNLWWNDASNVESAAAFLREALS